MEIYEESFTVPDTGLRTSALFRLLQDISGRQSTLFGRGQKDLAEKGLMWVVIRQVVDLERWPEPGETLLARTWPGVTRHSFCPRYYRLEDRQGALLLSGCAIWAVVDRQTRKMIVPSALGVEIDPLITGLESRRPPAPGSLEATGMADYTVPPEVLDENGHMNNTRYYELAERCIGRAGAHPRRIVTEHQNEIRLGQSMRVSWGWEGERCFIEGANDAPVFRMELDYGD